MGAGLTHHIHAIVAQVECGHREPSELKDEEAYAQAKYMTQRAAQPDSDRRAGAALGGQGMPMSIDDGAIEREGTPRRGSTMAALLAALGAGVTGILLLTVFTGRSQANQDFVGMPEFYLWVATVTALLGAAAAISVAAWPAFWALFQVTRRTAMFGALGVGVAVVLLLHLLPGFGNEVQISHPIPRIMAVELAVVVLNVPAFGGLILAGPRLRELRRDTRARVADGRARSVVAELLWLRTAMLRFLAEFAVIVTGATLATAALRAAVIAYGLDAAGFSATDVLAYGGVLTGLSALIFLPAYLAWQDAVAYLRGQLFPLPDSGIPSPEWSQGRSDFDTMMSARTSAASVFAAAFGILAPLASSIATASIQKLFQ